MNILAWLFNCTIFQVQFPKGENLKSYCDIVCLNSLALFCRQLFDHDEGIFGKKQVPPWSENDEVNKIFDDFPNPFCQI